MRAHLTPSRLRGLTLVELLVALTLGLIVIGALVAVFMSSNRNYRQNEALGALQDNARFALDSLSRDLAMAGYWGGVRPADAAVNVRVSSVASAAVSKTGTAGDCGPATQAAGYFWLFDVGVPIEFRNHTVSTAISDQFRCLLPANVQTNTDVLVIRRVSGQSAMTLSSASTVGTVTANRFYVKTNQNIASLFRADSSFSIANPNDCPDSSGSSAPCLPSSTVSSEGIEIPVQLYAYTPQIYYIRNYLRTAGDGLPILCRRYLDDTAATPTMAEDCLAEGVENLQVEWGIGSSTVDNYTSDPTPTQLAQALTARVHILVRSTSLNVQASNDAKTFTLADYTSPAQAGVLRRAFTTTVQLKNLQP